MSKTFRKFPEIIIHPPENVTASMPDITTKINSYSLKNCSVNENNLSCPDLVDETIYESSIFNQVKPANKSFDSYSSYDETASTASSDDNDDDLESLNEQFNVFHGINFNFEPTIKKQHCVNPVFCLRELRDLQNKLITPKVKYRKRLLLRYETPRRFNLNPSDYIKHKLKQSFSMHNLFHTVPVVSQNNYHTIHAYSNLHCNNYPDFMVGVTRCSSFDYLNKSSKLSKKSEQRKNKEIVYKCCCGMTRCKAVVPIQQYLETYFDKRVSERHTHTHEILYAE